MSNCYTCKKKFSALFNFKVDRRLCKECEQYFCSNCMPTIFGTNCKICKILNTRPINQSCIINIRARDLKMYLVRRKIETECCIEKDDLVKCFFKYLTVEPQLKKKRNHSYFKDVHNNISGSTPNLVETNRSTYNNCDGSSRCYTPPVRSPYVASSNVTASASSHLPTAPPPESAPPTVDFERVEEPLNINLNETTTNNSAFVPDNSSTHSIHQHTENTASFDLPSIQHVKLSNISDVDDINKLSIKQLKELLMVNRVDFKGCVEKDELRNKVKHLWTQYQNKEDITDLPVGELCKICMDAPLNSVLLECGHIATCIDCGKQLAECPICRQYVVRVVHTFKA